MREGIQRHVKRFTPAQLQNMIFIGVVMLVAAAVVVFMLLKEKPAAPAAPQNSAAAATQAPTKRFEAAPTDVMLVSLSGSGRLRLTKVSEGEYEVALADGAAGVTTTLRVTEPGGRLTSLLWIFSVPKAPPDKPKTADGERQLEEYTKQMADIGDQVSMILQECITACDLQDALLPPIVRAWCDGARKALSKNKDYKNTAKSCTFTAYMSETGGADVLVCGLLLD